MDYDELLTTTELFTDLVMDSSSSMSDTDGDGMETTTLKSVYEASRVLGLYDIFIPLLGVFIIVLNLAVVVSSGLILKKGK